MAALQADDLPGESPRVYALYRDGAPMHVGLAEKQSLRGRFWGSHPSRGVLMTGSALRRIVEWIDGCEVAWIASPTPRAAKDLERDMKAEYKPPLTRR
jgi:hypothetical protein